MSQPNYQNHVLYRIAQTIIDISIQKFCLGNLLTLQEILNTKFDAYFEKLQKETKLLDQEYDEENLQKKRKRA